MRFGTDATILNGRSGIKTPSENVGSEAQKKRLRANEGVDDKENNMEVCQDLGMDLRLPALLSEAEQYAKS